MRSVGISRPVVSGGIALALLGACNGTSASAPSRSPSPAPAPASAPAPAVEQTWTFWPLPPQPFPPVRLLPGAERSVTVFSVSEDRPNLADDAAAIERSSQEPRAALENFGLGTTPHLASSWRHPMRLEPMSVPVVASGPNGSVVAAGNWVTGTRELNDAIVPSLEIQSDGYLQHIDARGSISGQRKLPPLWMQSVLQNDAATFILEQEDDPDASSLSFRLSVRIVGLDARPERHVSLTTSGSQVAGPMVALPDGGIVVGAPFGVIEADAGSEESSQFIWLAADGSPRFTREVVGATRTFSINDGLAMVATAKGSIAVALRCLGETRLLQAGPAPIILPGTEFTKETHDLCLWHYDQQGQAHGAQRLRRLGYLSIATLIEVPNGELWLLGNADDRAHLWRFDAAWTARGELPIPDEVSSIQDLVVLSNRDILALVALKNSGFALAQLPKPGTPAETPK